MGKGNILSDAALWSLRCSLVLTLGLLLLFPSLSQAADQTLCAEVKIEIRQELALERQAFDAHMRITNGLRHLTLENVDVDVSFKDEDGNTILAASDPNNPDALFYISVDSMEGIEDVNGSGTVAPSSTADIRWLIIPAPGASNGLEQGTLYYVGAALKYSIGGEEHITHVTPDYVFVKPMPELTLDYFFPSDVYGDDAFTPEIEPPVPFSLGVRVRNYGTGVARDLKINSAQPKIVDNEQGLLIGFLIERSEVNGQPATNSLLVNFGDIAPSASGVARWIMTCSLSGKFVEFTADYSHSDQLGGELTSLLQTANTHLLVQDVLVDVAGRDGVRDFLAKDSGIYRVYESDPGTQDAEVLDVSASSSLNGQGPGFTLSVPLSAGFIYVKISDPYDGQKDLDGVVRSDGKRVKPENAWLSKSRNENHEWEYFFNLFDADTTGSYSVTFAEAAGASNAPVLQFIPDRRAVEGEQISFVVEATDADGTIPSLSAAPIPALASFADHGDGTGTFDWIPAEGQAGRYPITFTASDGLLEGAQPVLITVNPVDDTDGDGMKDAWEMANFNVLDHDGTADSDGDGMSDLQEFLRGTDPNLANRAPTPPVIHWPLDAAEISHPVAGLVVENSTDPDGDPVTYDFELYSDRWMTILVAGAYDLPEGTLNTSWGPPDGIQENTWYEWRVRASDGFSYTPWVYGRFFVNTRNDPPGPPGLSAPPEGTEVDSGNPLLEITNSVDPDGDAVTYTFEVYPDSAMSQLLASSPPLTSDPSGSTRWVVDSPLEDNTWYYWRAAVLDEHGMGSETPPASFLVNMSNAAPGKPGILTPALGSEVTVQDPDLVVENGTDPDGDSLVYLFEADRVRTLDSPAKMSSGIIGEGFNTTSWRAAGLEDNTQIFWRVRAEDGRAAGPWAQGVFFVNTANDPPAAPSVRNPGGGAWVDSQTPLLELNPTRDPDNDSLIYEFEAYRDASLTELAVQGQSVVRHWSVPFALGDGSRYYWRARAVDEHGTPGAWSEVSDFFVKDNGVDDPPAITWLDPAQAFLTNGAPVRLSWEDSDPDSNADIALYYDTDLSGEDGIRIVEGLKEDEDGAADAYLWDLTGVPDGTYYLYAVIHDGTQGRTSYKPAGVTVDTAPPILDASPPGGTYDSVQDVTLATNESADIYYTVDGSEPTLQSIPYVSPIEVSEDMTLKAVAVDAAGNVSDPAAFTYVIQREVMISVNTDKGRPLTGLKAYAFTSAGRYTGRYAVTDAAGVGRFGTDPFDPGDYKFRVDYLGGRFWSDVVSIPEAASTDLIIPEETAVISVSTGAGPAQGVRVYLFSDTGSYLGLYGITDGLGRVVFDLPAGRAFKFRADILGNRYWSDVSTIAAGGVNHLSLDTQGGLFEVRLQKGPGAPMPGIKVYLFNTSGSYLGQRRVTDASGVAVFDVSGGTYKVRADYMGYKFWSPDTVVSVDTVVDLDIPHWEGEVTVAGSFQDIFQPLEGVRVYLFTPAGSYLGQYRVTDQAGRALFDLPKQPYRVRADYLGRRYWSDVFTWQDVQVTIPMADVEITVTGGGFPKPGVNVYAFTDTGAYLGLVEATDADGKVMFRLPEDAYTFRVDYLGSRYWSPEQVLTSHEVNHINLSVGGGAFTLRVLKDLSSPLSGVKCYAFTEQGRYVGLFGATNTEGEVTFDLAEGAYRFRVDHMGQQFWSEVMSPPDMSEAEMFIEHERAEVAVSMASGPAQGVRVYLFSDTGSYLGLYRITDDLGQVVFDLPVGRAFKFRADILGNRYWSDVSAIEAGGVNHIPLDAGGGLFQVALQKGPDAPMAGVKLYLFSESDVYLGVSQVTDEAGRVTFPVPQAAYKVRADYMGYRFWSPETQVDADTALVMTLRHHPVEVRVAGLFQTTATPLEGVKVYLLSESGAYLGLTERTGPDGTTSFRLPAGTYRFRADLLGSRYWVTSTILPDMVNEVNIDTGGGEFVFSLDTGQGPLSGVKVYVFSASGAYLGLSGNSDQFGQVRFNLSGGSYKFRVDHLGYAFWSQVIEVPAQLAASLTLPHQDIVITVQGVYQSPEPLAGLTVYLFKPSGSYLGLKGVTDASGQVSFHLPDAPYKVRADYLGLKFWSEEFQSQPAWVTIDEGLARVHVQRSGSDVEGARVYLFSEGGSYLGWYGHTDASGILEMQLAARPFKFRVDYEGGQTWSPVIHVAAGEVTAVDMEIQ
ncbi:MAG: chitobiase/beta-hexosaminidase C-terminal domain-containing protein [Deltaproteobacteria bacterium]|nr:chitobiase/beta-hexosaminidase C-terminal domain-containing protein [Deltaproteobacteria bacterium]